MRISDWSSYVCSSDLVVVDERIGVARRFPCREIARRFRADVLAEVRPELPQALPARSVVVGQRQPDEIARRVLHLPDVAGIRRRSEEHTSELQSLMRISYAVFCLKKKNNLYKY